MRIFLFLILLICSCSKMVDINQMPQIVNFNIELPNELAENGLHYLSLKTEYSDKQYNFICDTSTTIELSIPEDIITIKYYHITLLSSGKYTTTHCYYLECATSSRLVTIEPVAMVNTLECSQHETNDVVLTVPYENPIFKLFYISTVSIVNSSGKSVRYTKKVDGSFLFEGMGVADDEFLVNLSYTKKGSDDRAFLDSQGVYITTTRLEGVSVH